MKTIIAYTDGSAVATGKNKGKAGYGVYFPDFFGKRRGVSQKFSNGSVGQMEAMALLKAISCIPEYYKEPLELIVYSDSEYIVKAFTEKRLFNWISRGWKTSAGIEIKNLKIWKAIAEELCKKQKGSLKLKLKHIKSHQIEREKDKKKKEKLLKNPHIVGNAMADRLANYKKHFKKL